VIGTVVAVGYSVGTIVRFELIGITDGVVKLYVVVWIGGGVPIST